MLFVSDPTNLFDLQSSLAAIERMIDFYTQRYTRDPEGCPEYERGRMNALFEEYCLIQKQIDLVKSQGSN